MINRWNGKQINMRKCQCCSSYFAEWSLSGGKCKECLDTPVAKEIVAEKKANEEQPKQDKQGN